MTKIPDYLFSTYILQEYLSAWMWLNKERYREMFNQQSIIELICDYQNFQVLFEQDGTVIPLCFNDFKSPFYDPGLDLYGPYIWAAQCCNNNELLQNMV